MGLRRRVLILSLGFRVYGRGLRAHGKQVRVKRFG